VSAEGTGALLFFGHYDQTDLFFKMSRILSINTNKLDRSLQRKLGEDIPAFNPSISFERGQNNIIMLERAPMTKTGLVPSADTHGHDAADETHKH
jgi:hypothetical protein